jgi:hypothetical protein
MTRFVSNITDLNHAAAKLADFIVQAVKRTIAAKTAATATLTAAEMINGIVRQSGTIGAQNTSTATAAALVAVIENCQVGSSFEFILMNTSDNTTTITAGAGVTLVGTVAVPTNKTQIYRGVVTAVDTPAVSLVGLLYAPA